MLSRAGPYGADGMISGHRIAITQARGHAGARALLKRCQETTRDTTKGGFRVLQRHLSDVIYRALAADHHAHNDGTWTSRK
ncbi:hypothetical protein GCM10012278_53310 [Nonomuraea glycinis]|uniref:Transposase n=1 Tax=Nonomuraea glycinis TaxID=2047744 RepID=A0A918A822_9ACTN|nr:hypothetical protein GCM10012278_53310 [Nonomuraea glycinis]